MQPGSSSPHSKQPATFPHPEPAESIPRYRILNYTGPQIFKQFPAFCAVRKFITAFKTARNLPTSWASRIHSTISHPNLYIFNIIFPSAPMSSECSLSFKLRDSINETTDDQDHKYNSCDHVTLSRVMWHVATPHMKAPRKVPLLANSVSRQTRAQQGAGAQTAHCPVFWN